MHKSFKNRIAALERATPAPALPGIGQGRAIRFSLVDGLPIYERADAPGWDAAVVDAALGRLRAWAKEVCDAQKF